MSHSELEDFIFNQQNLFKELSGASPPGTPLGLCPGPTWGLKAAPDHCQKLAPPLQILDPPLYLLFHFKQIACPHSFHLLVTAKVITLLQISLGISFSTGMLE